MPRAQSAGGATHELLLPVASPGWEWPFRLAHDSDATGMLARCATRAYGRDAFHGVRRTRTGTLAMPGVTCPCDVTNPGRGKSPLVGAIHELPLPKRHRFATRRVLPRAIHESPLPLNPCRAHRMKWVIKGRKHGPDKQVPPLCGLEARVYPDRSSSCDPGKVVKAKAFTKKRR